MTEQDTFDELKYKITRNGNGIFYSYHNKLHRDDDQPAAIWVDGAKYWYKNGLMHREDDKPAVVYPNGRMMWFRYNKLHRENGPALISADGTEEYWINGKRIS